MSWWDEFYDFEDFLKRYVGTLQWLLKDFIKQIAGEAAAKFYEGLELGKGAIEATAKWIDDHLEYLMPKLISRFGVVENFARQLNDVLKIDIDKRLRDLAGIIDKLPIISLSDIYSRIQNAKDFAQQLSDVLDIKINREISNVMTALGSIEEVVGEARVTFFKALQNAINEVREDAEDARNSISTVLYKAVDLVQAEANNARALLKKNVDKAIAVLEREAKEAREILEGNLIYMLEGLDEALRKVVEELGDTLDILIQKVANRVNNLEDWVLEAAKWFDKELNKYKARIVTWIVDTFEEILDRVFK